MNYKNIILIIDDNPENLQVLGNMLDREGYEILIASNGPQAFEIIKPQLPDLILLDIMMPEMNGFEVCRHLKADPELSLIPVIFISAMGMTDHKIQGFREGAVDYITKPFHAEEVIARVRTHLQLTQIGALKREIAERKRAEEALIESEKRFRTLTEDAPIAIAMVRGAEYIYVNRTHASIFGYHEPDDLVGTRFTDSIASENKMDFVACAEHLEKEKISSSQIEVTALRRDGSRFPYLISITRTKLPDGPVILVFGIDISERQRVRELVIQNEKMLMIGGLAAGVAHEINNPLSTIVQGVQNLERRFSPTLQSNLKIAEEIGLDMSKVLTYMEQRDIVSYIINMRKAADRASYIASNLLQFSSPNEKTHQLADINDIIDQSIGLASMDADLRNKCDFRFIRITRDYDPALPKVSVNITEIEQVLINLLKNAAQSMNIAGTEKPAIIIHTFASGLHVVITVEDNGPGMNDEVRQKVFDPFFTTKGYGHGTGLGLSVSHAIITNNHGGTISVETEPGKGACFSISLPISVLKGNS